MRTSAASVWKALSASTSISPIVLGHQRLVKVKCVQSKTFMAVGYEPSTASPSGLASLVLAAYRGDELVHVGNVGPGFKEAEMIRLRKILDKLRWKESSRLFPGKSRHCLG
ncbi:hypothetical protein [Agrobacterium tumefaciens]|uniref:ATP dependent DNA ligase n=1 Tax=Agrobacterium tumefaciens TaxID=358 RepID=UPI001F27FFE7|nr:hypothetical protein [Agrobacterium tumefaciens]WCK74432.1 hypothetical protein G6L96_026690 [Agrobacterium tumefaciens]